LDAAVRGEAAGLAAGREHPVTWHHDRERVPAERLAHRARGARRAEPRSDLAVGERRARRDRARDLVDAAVEGRHALHVERDVRELARLAAQQRDDAALRALHVGRRRPLVGTRETRLHASARGLLARLGKLDADDAPLAPGDAASPDRRLEERKATFRHVADHRSTAREDGTSRILLSAGCDQGGG
jgi:hypothetical protein